jgi:hypothetical protein
LVLIKKRKLKQDIAYNRKRWDIAYNRKRWDIAYNSVRKVKKAGGGGAECFFGVGAWWVGGRGGVWG